MLVFVRLERITYERRVRCGRRQIRRSTYLRHWHRWANVGRRRLWLRSFSYSLRAEYGCRSSRQTTYGGGRHSQGLDLACVWPGRSLGGDIPCAGGIYLPDYTEQGLRGICQSLRSQHRRLLKLVADRSGIKALLWYV